MTFLIFLLLIAAVYFIFLVKAKFEDIKRVATAIEKEIVEREANTGIQLCNIAAVIGIISITLIIGAYFGG